MEDGYYKRETKKERKRMEHKLKEKEWKENLFLPSYQIVSIIDLN